MNQDNASTTIIGTARVLIVALFDRICCWFLLPDS